MRDRRDHNSRLPNVASLEPLLRRLGQRGASVPILYVEPTEDEVSCSTPVAARLRKRTVAAAIKTAFGRCLRRGDRAVAGPGGRWYLAVLSGRAADVRCGSSSDADLGLAAERLRRCVQATLQRAGDATRAARVRCGWTVFEARPTREPLAALRQAVRGAAVVARVEERRAVVLSAVTHELRTPLAAMSGFAELLAGPGRPASQARAASIIAAESRRLARLAESLIDLGAWHSGGLKLRRSRVDLGELARAAIAYVGDRARAKGLTCTVRGGCRLAADRDRLLQALLNILDNAVHHAPPGSRVRVTVSRTPTTCRLTVSDQGPGPAPDVTRRLGRPFVRDARGKVGLGLAIAKVLVEAHGGILRLARRRGRTIATIVLPRPTRRYPKQRRRPGGQDRTPVCA